MINILFTKSKNFQKELSNYLDSRKPNDKLKIEIVKKIISDVKKNRDQSLVKYEKRFSKFKKLSKNNLVFSKSEINKIIKRLDKKTKKSINIAFKRIYNFQGEDSLQRLKWLMKYQPLILSKLSNKMIASYLGVTPYTLSRLKSKL